MARNLLADATMLGIRLPPKILFCRWLTSCFFLGLRVRTLEAGLTYSGYGEHTAGNKYTFRVPSARPMPTGGYVMTHRAIVHSSMNK